MPGTRFDPQVGWWSHWTQAIGNAFPPWHAARKNVMGRTQVFLNAPAMAVEEVQRQIVTFRRNAYLDTADPFQPDAAFRIPLVRELRQNQQDFPLHNLLYNADFSMRGPARIEVPFNWDPVSASTTGTITHYTANALVGTGCVKMEADDGEDCYLRQKVTVPVGGTTASSRPVYVTGSIWVLVAAATGGATVGTLQVKVTNSDGTTDTQTVALPSGTGGAWRRLSVSASTQTRMEEIEYQIHLDNDSGSTVEMFLDAAQLEIGDKARPWELHPRAVPYWLQRPVLSPVYLEAVPAGINRTVGPITYPEYARRRVWLTAWERDWWDQALPTRVGTFSSYTGSLTSTTQDTWGFEADETSRQRRTTKFSISENRVKLVDSTTISDEYQSYTLAERWLDYDRIDRFAVWEDEGVGFSRTLEALTVHRDRLWIISKETYNSVTRRVLKIVRPASNAYVLADDTLNDYLEVVVDFDTGLATGTCTAIGFATGRDDLLLATIDAQTYELEVFYDYAYFSVDDPRALLLRHEYASDKLVMS